MSSCRVGGRGEEMKLSIPEWSHSPCRQTHNIDYDDLDDDDLDDLDDQDDLDDDHP